MTPETLQDPDLRTDVMGQGASIVAKFPSVRQALLQFQKDFAANPKAANGSAPGVVMDGRDIGTVICPDAQVKLFVTASLEERTRRRYEELRGKGIAVTKEDVLADMTARDARDMDRDAAPLKAADDAHMLDTTMLDQEEALERAFAIIRGAA